MRRLHARINQDLHAALKARAAGEGRSMSDLVTDLLAEAIDAGKGAAAIHAQPRRPKRRTRR